MGKVNLRGIAISGISSALIVLSLYAGALIINNKLFFMALGVAIAGIPYASSGIKMGLLSYTASSILSFTLLPNKMYALMFIFLGIFPLIKLVGENKNILIEFLYKLIWFNSTLAVLFYVFNNFIHLEGIFSYLIGKALLVVVANGVFILYDFTFTKFIMLILDRVLKKS